MKVIKSSEISELQKLINSKNKKLDSITLLFVDSILVKRGYIKMNKDDVSVTYQKWNDVITYNWFNEVLSINDVYSEVVTSSYEFEEVIRKFERGFYNKEWIRE
jgi:signal transduction histidine kinase